MTPEEQLAESQRLLRDIRISEEAIRFQILRPEIVTTFDHPDNVSILTEWCATQNPPLQFSAQNFALAFDACRHLLRKYETPEEEAARILIEKEEAERAVKEAEKLAELERRNARGPLSHISHTVLNAESERREAERIGAIKKRQEQEEARKKAVKVELPTIYFPVYMSDGVTPNPNYGRIDWAKTERAREAAGVGETSQKTNIRLKGER
jgi:hypothetical protein